MSRPQKPPKKSTPKPSTSKPSKAKAPTSPTDASTPVATPPPAPTKAKRGRARRSPSAPPEAEVVTERRDDAGTEGEAHADEDARDGSAACPFDAAEALRPARAVASTRPEVVMVPRPEGALPGESLLLALRFVLPAAAIKGEMHQILFTRAEGHNLVVARGPERLHVAYLPEVEDWKLHGAAAPASVGKVSRLLGALREDDQAVVIGSVTGRITIRRMGQPAIEHELDLSSLPCEWRPLPDGREATAFPLLLSADHVLKAVRYPGGTVEIEQRTSARAIFSIKVGDTLVARAWLAERGHRLYPEPEAPPPPQPRLPGVDFDASRGVALARVASVRVGPPAPVGPSAPAAPAAPMEAPAFPALRDDGRASLHIDLPTWSALPSAAYDAVLSFPWVVTKMEGSSVILAAMNPAEVAAVAAVLGPAGLRCAEVKGSDDGTETWIVASTTPSAAEVTKMPEPEEVAPRDTHAGDAPCFPEPGERSVVVEIPEALWDEFTPDQINELHTPTKVHVSWLTGPTSTSSSKMAADEARAVGEILAGWGLRCERVTDTTRYGYEVTVWTVGRRGERQGAAV